MQVPVIDATRLTFKQLKARGDQALTALRQQSETHEMLLAAFGPDQRTDCAKMASQLDRALAALSTLHPQSSGDSSDDTDRLALQTRLIRLHTFLVDIGICEHDKLPVDPDRTTPASITTKERKSGLLTRREREVLTFIVEGHSTKRVAEILGITFKTAACHRYRVMDKLNIHDTATLVRYAIRAGFVQA